MKETDLKQKEIKNKLILAKKYLSGAENSLKSGDLRLAVDAAYNSAELVMKALILTKENSLPKRHGGIAQLFGLLFIKEGPLRREEGSKITGALEWRNKARYDPGARVTKQIVEACISLAQNLVSFSKEVL